ncbi:MAG: hypothetical protein A2X82_07275 [Geobacteraceae bacterium GWC2_55_20]|nr:hypothetical protein [Deltaproteobacteria bacterium]OGU05219.1 MAG: hypothetical protein A2X82_07275 [Geobacteraceae bacterium GWC2_55_20]HBA73002.1 hypothetical protein [Geobacter sp.]HCE66424.1 hypothetical protein [Geobacter sp.]
MRFTTVFALLLSALAMTACDRQPAVAPSQAPPVVVTVPGPPGPAGPVGPQGTMGAPAEKGATGATGMTGSEGAKGEQGGTIVVVPAQR